MRSGRASDVTSIPLAERLVGPFHRFAQTESASGLVLLACTALALLWSNSAWSDSYTHLWEQTVTVGGAGWGLSMTLQHWINDGLMAVFFFLVALEIKREFLVGDLASVRHAALPIAAALGGMVVPAMLYAVLNHGTGGARGWGIPMATDIAFALGVLALVGPRVPAGLRVLLAALAIVDDLGAVLVIALFYTASLGWDNLVVAAGIVALLATCNVAGVRHGAVYALLGVALWLALLHSGVHATIAGVLLAVVVPVRTRIDEDEFLLRGREALDDFERACGPATTVLSNPAQQEAIARLEQLGDQAQAPLVMLEQQLRTPVAFVIMPLFALANAGVALGGHARAAFATPVTIGVMLGLVLGKPIGITLFSWLAVRSRMAALPTGVSWRAVHSLSWIGGIGFTMSLFIAGLAFGASPLLESAKLGILSSSVIAGIIGWTLLRRSLRSSPTAAAAPDAGVGSP
ncbi:MAG TPA: Na+/H+ antiporter NhaA [Gemmatimonadaceae bacterium]|jgi:NhaA family Na+:H+ antiporter